MRMQSTSSAVSAPTRDRASHTTPPMAAFGRSPARRLHDQRAQLLRADRLVNVGRDRDASCRTSEQRAVSAVAAAHRSRRRAAHLHMRAMSTTCRPSTLVQRRHRTRSRAGRGSPSAPAAERLAHHCSIHPSIHGVRRRVLLELKLGVPPTAQHVDRSAPEFDGDTATCVLRVPVMRQSRQRCASVRVRERYTRLCTPKGPYPVQLYARFPDESKS
jgi:hypothetical protein